MEPQPPAAQTESRWRARLGLGLRVAALWAMLALGFGALYVWRERVRFAAEAIARGDAQATRRWLWVVDPNATHRSSYQGVVTIEKSLISIASETGQPGMARLLLDAGATGDLASFLVTLDVDEQRGHPMLRYLMKRVDLSPNQRKRFFFEAIEFGSPATLRLLRDAGWERPAGALYFAVRVNRLDIARFLLLDGADPNADPATFDPQFSVYLPSVNYLFLSPLFTATMAQETEMATLLLRHGAESKQDDGQGYTPLHFAAMNGDLRLARALIEAGANPNAGPAQGAFTPLDAALTSGHRDVAAYLKSQGAMTGREYYQDQTN